MKRLFIAINIPPDIKKRIEEIIEDSKAEIRFLPPENWHLTISFLGYQPDEAVSPIIESLKETAEYFPAPLIVFDKTIFGPPAKPARMIWLISPKEISQNLDKIKNYLEDSLAKNRVSFQRENRAFNNHLTLVRFQRDSMPNLADIKLPPIDLIKFQAQNLDLMESHLKRTGAEYEILTSINFKVL